MGAASRGARTRVLARARKGWIDAAIVGNGSDPGLRALYIIDLQGFMVGQAPQR